ncbi:MAG: hypothetical protein JST61_06610 [Acidobacteria bacterium]|nr:hypothetical protein [Acidobacteriota bacterium]
MAFGASLRRVVESTLAVAASALMLYFGNGLEPVWPLMWIVFVPVLWFALRSPWWAAALVAALSMLLGDLNMWSYYTKTLEMPASMWWTAFSIAALAFAAGVLLFRALVLRGVVWSGLIALPSLWVAVEYSRYFTTPHGTAGSLAYSQLGFLPFLQLSSVTGPWGMTFVLLLFSSAVAVAWHLWPCDRRKAQRVAATAVCVAVAVVALGAVRLALPEGATTRVGLVASDLKQNESVARPGSPTQRLLGDYERAAEGLTARGAQAIVVPEMLGVALDGNSTATDAVMQSLADRSGATVVAGLIAVDGGVQHNEARVYAPGTAVEGYYKEHLLPPGESKTTPGTQRLTLTRNAQLWGVAICKDMDFKNPARLYAREGVGLMLVPAWDFVVDRSWHGHIAVMRGVEDGFSIARAAKGGWLTVSDDRGRIVGEASSSAAPFATLLVDVPAVHRWTVYQAMGDWFAWVAIALLALLFVQLARTRSVAV